MQIPLCKNKFKSKEIVSAKQFAEAFHFEEVFKTIKPVGAILIVNPQLIEFLVKPLRPKIVKSHTYAKVYVIKYKTKNILIITGYGFGSAAMAHTIEELYARGVNKFINFGGGGGISKELKCGDIVIFNKALRDEGTSYHYLKPSRYVEASKELTNKLINTAKKEKIKFNAGAVWTTDAMFRETEAELIKYRNEGILAVEMEIATLFAVSKVRNLESSAIMIIYDILEIGKWKLKKTGLKRREKNLQKAFNVTLETIIN